MKNYIVITALLTSGLSFSQTAVSKIAKDTCSKLGDPAFSKNTAPEAMQTEMETWVLNEIITYKDEIHKENGLDVTDILNDEDVQQELAEQVAGEMLTQCPGTMLKISKNAGLLNNTRSDDDDE